MKTEYVPVPSLDKCLYSQIDVENSHFTTELHTLTIQVYLKMKAITNPCTCWCHNLDFDYITQNLDPGCNRCSKDCSSIGNILHSVKM